MELAERKFFPVCDKDECKKKFWGIEEKTEVNFDCERKQNRTEQNRTEQNRTEQKKPDNNFQQKPKLNNQIQDLKEEISQLENNPQTDQILLNSKKTELKELQKQVNQQVQPKENNSKLYWGIGLGVLGGGLLGLVLWLVFRKKEE